MTTSLAVSPGDTVADMGTPRRTRPLTKGARLRRSHGLTRAPGDCTHRAPLAHSEADSQAPYLYTDRDTAIGRLKRLGLDYDERLDLDVDVPRIGKLDRYFALLGNVFDARRKATDSVLVEHLIGLLEDPDNAKLRDRLRTGDLGFTPLNKHVVQALAAPLAQAGVHLPWAFRPMNFDLGARLATLHRKAPFPFSVFYNQNVTFSDLQEATPGRVFSLPVASDPRGTWDQTIYDHLLDEDVGMLIEVNVIHA